jgi:hypothetical protein
MNFLFHETDGWPPRFQRGGAATLPQIASLSSWQPRTAEKLFLKFKFKTCEYFVFILDNRPFFESLLWG